MNRPAMATIVDEIPLKGRTAQRLSTPPLRALTPATSSGFGIVDWARETLDWQPMPWQIWVLVHANELLPDRRPRFTTRLVLAGRQVGKTMLTVVNALYAVAHGVPLVLGTSTTIS